MARQRAAPLLRLPQHGWAGDVLHRDSVVCAARAVARISLRVAAPALGPDVAGAVSLHRNHVRLDDRRTRPSALVDLRFDAHRSRHFAPGLWRQCPIHSDRFLRDVRCAFAPVPFTDLLRGQARSDRASAGSGCPGTDWPASLIKALAMATFWFWTVVAMLAAYATLDGFDLGAGIIYLLVARTDAERRAVLRSIGPVWGGNEVWLIAGGGVLFLAFPALYASSFSGFYLPLMIVLWLFMLRGISLEFRNHLDSPAWAPGWDVVFAAATF